MVKYLQLYKWFTMYSMYNEMYEKLHNTHSSQVMPSQSESKTIVYPLFRWKFINWFFSEDTFSCLVYSKFNHKLQKKNKTT